MLAVNYTTIANQVKRTTVTLTDQETIIVTRRPTAILLFLVLKQYNAMEKKEIHARSISGETGPWLQTA